MKLFPYQETGAEWLSRGRFRLLADEMGLGKTAQTVVGADLTGARRILVICPSVARITWKREIEEWELFPRNITVLQSLSDRPVAGASAVCSFDYAARNAAELRNAGPWDLLVIDEVHFLKSITAKRAAAVFGAQGIASAAGRVWVLSGTPAPNHAGELWVLLTAFGVTRLSYRNFVSRFCTCYQTGFGAEPRITGTKAERIPELKSLLSRIMLRRKKSDVLKELPEIMFSEITVEPGIVDLDIESSFTNWVFPTDRRQELADLLAKEESVLEGFMGLKAREATQIKALEGMAASVSTLRRYNGIQKVDGVAKLVASEFAIGLYEKLVIFAIHRDVIEGLRVRLAKFHPVTLYGGTEVDRKQRNVDRFQKDPKCKVFIGNILAAGTNITLTSAHHVLFIEQDWVPGNNAQAAMRCHRIGQKKNVSVRFVSLDTPLDQRVTHILRKKTRELAEIFDGP
jgi:SWI/SNF-related matrix-associated actin-dependent regulator 1 of chromatin subfamily A